MRAAVLGAPIAHSLSPVLHRAAYAEMGLSGWTYAAIECPESRLASLLDSLDASWAGLSLTMPLKRVVIPMLDTAADLATAVGGVNTVLLRDGRRHGENTDVHGIVAALGEAGVDAPSSAVVLGGGATACSALAALGDMGLPEATVLVRNGGDVVAAASRLGIAVAVRTYDERLPQVDLVVSTLPVGVADSRADEVAAAAPVVMDVVYAPWPTRLALAVAEAGGTLVGGFPMLLHQAARQVTLMTGRRDVPLEAMRRAGENELTRRAGG